MGSDTTGLRYLIDSYREWTAGEDILVVEAVGVDLNTVETSPWPRLGGGCRGAFVHLRGRGDFVALQLIDIPPGGSTGWLRHLYDEVFHVLAGHGRLEIEAGAGDTRSLDWGPRAVFSPPLNVPLRLSNPSRDTPARLVCANNLPFVMNVFRNETFVFDNPATLPVRQRGPAFSKEVKVHAIEQGRFILETGFVPDLAALELPEWRARGAGSRNAELELSSSSMHVHASEIPPGTYNKGRVAAGPHVIMVAGTGYTLNWKAGDAEFERHDWRPGVSFVAPADMYHQHFNTGAQPSRHLAVSFGSYRVPVLARLARRNQEPARSTKDGGPQIDFEDQDPRIHALWERELASTGVVSHMMQDAQRTGVRP